jgi:Sap, sulfolipid-1-addressing protein
MDVAALLALAGLAIVDSTSIGTLVLPVLMLAHPRVRASRVLIYLTTISLFYLALGVLLLVGAGALAATVTDAVDSLEGNRAVDVVQLVVGAGLLAVSFWPDTRWGNRARARRAESPASGRTGRWVDTVVADGAKVSTVIGVALVAGLIEAASMLPYLGAVAIVGSSGLALPGQVGVLTAYVAVMVLPALALLAVRFAAHGWLSPRLGRVSAVLTGQMSGVIWWVVGIVGFLLCADAAGRLFGS